MPSTFSTLDTGFPSFTGEESTEQKVSALYDYTFMLLENLRYILRNLSPENFNDTEMLDWIGRNIKAETVISNTVITNELYSEYGAIADLVVNELRTDYTKAQRYLAGNVSAIDYLYIHDEEIDYITGSVKKEDDVPLTEQLHHGARYFWWTDATMTQMTSIEQTPYPVMVYQYNELLKGTYRFTAEAGSTNRIPELVFGAGIGSQTDPDRGKGFIRKNSSSFDLWFVKNNSDHYGMFIGDYTDLVGLRKPTELDFSGWDSGVFVETLDGDLVNSFTVTFDEDDNPVTFTDGAGHETEVVW